MRTPLLGLLCTIGLFVFIVLAAFFKPFEYIYGGVLLLAVLGGLIYFAIEFIKYLINYLKNY